MTETIIAQIFMWIGIIWTACATLLLILIASGLLIIDAKVTKSK